jgi:signal transduction histidine kinase
VTYERLGSLPTVDEQTGIHVYRVLQEALGNAARHSGAGHVVVRLRSTADAIELEVQDDGRGFKPEPGGRGLGVVAMRERAALIGGTVEFNEAPGGGTLVILRVPIASRSAVA